MFYTAKHQATAYLKQLRIVLANPLLKTLVVFVAVTVSGTGYANARRRVRHRLTQNYPEIDTFVVDARLWVIIVRPYLDNCLVTTEVYQMSQKIYPD